jgi:hypothetical protein
MLSWAPLRRVCRVAQRVQLNIIDEAFGQSDSSHFIRFRSVRHPPLWWLRAKIGLALAGVNRSLNSNSSEVN